MEPPARERIRGLPPRARRAGEGAEVAGHRRLEGSWQRSEHYDAHLYAGVDGHRQVGRCAPTRRTRPRGERRKRPVRDGHLLRARGPHLRWPPDRALLRVLGHFHGNGGRNHPGVGHER